MNTKHLQGPYKHVFMDEAEIQAQLTLMERSVSLNTKPGYNRYTSSSIRRETFRNRHTTYLKAHPKINPEHYLSNLRTVLRVRP